VKTAVITGANRGLGLALTTAFLRAGWQVVAVARHAIELPANPALRIEQCDLRDGAAIQALAGRLQGVSVDVLINNAAVYDSPSPQDAHAADDPIRLAEVFAVNTVAPKALADLLVPNLQAGADKLVVTISSGMGTYAEFEQYHAEHWAYSASKAAVNYAMVSFAELHKDIKATLINPGWMQTAIGGDDAPLTPEESAAAILDLIVNHEDKLPNARMVDYSGEPMNF
jgi:NAD(P)-dependent dehydrogenase (short-subunit alcohol dehydrogenase family)